MMFPARDHHDGSHPRSAVPDVLTPDLDVVFRSIPLYLSTAWPVTCALGPAAPYQASSRAARHPGLRRDYERWLRQPLPAELAQRRAPIGLEAGDVRARRGDAERERLPPVLERGVLDVHRDGAVDDVADSNRAKRSARSPALLPGQTDPADLDRRWARLRSDVSTTNRVVEIDGRVVGHLASFDLEGRREVTYWIGREDWAAALPRVLYKSSCSWRRADRFTLAPRATTPRRFVC